VESLTKTGNQSHTGTSLGGELDNLMEYLLSGSSGEDNSKKSEVNSPEVQGDSHDEVKQAQARLAKIIADAQTTAQDQVDAMVRVATAVSEEAQKVIQSSREKAAIIEVESRQTAEQLLEDTKRRLNDQIRKDVKGPVDELLTYMSGVVKKVQKLSVSLEQCEVTAPPAVDSILENGSTGEEIPATKDSGNQQPAVDLKQPLGVRGMDRRGL